jgi:hypothetical protein
MTKEGKMYSLLATLFTVIENSGFDNYFIHQKNTLLQIDVNVMKEIIYVVMKRTGISLQEIS